MTSEFTATFRGTYIRIEHPRGSELTEQGLVEFWRELEEICRRHQCFKVLSIVIAPKRRMSIMNSFGSGETASRHLAGVKLACCFLEYEPDEQTEFFAHVAQNRGLNLAVFTDEATALEWLGVAPRQQDGPGGA